MQLRRNFFVNVAEGALSNQVNAVFLSQSAVLPLFLVQLSDARWVLGVLSAIAYLNFFPQLLGAAFTASSRQFWPSFQRQMLVCRLSLLFLALAPWLPDPWALPAFLLCFAGYCLVCGFALPVWNEFMAFVIPSEVRGRFLGWRIALGSALGLGGTWIVSRLLLLPGRGGFVACFSIAACLYFLGFFLIRQTRFDWEAVDRERVAQVPFREEVRRLLTQGRDFRRYVLCRGLLAVGLGANAFYLVHGMTVFRLSPSQASLFALAFTVAPGLSAMGWGRVVDRWGAWRVLAVMALVIACAHLVLLRATSLGFFALCLFLIGTGTVLFTIGDRKWLSEVDCAHRGAAIGLFNLLLLPVIVLSSLLAGFSAEAWGLGTVFRVAAFTWGTGGLALFWGAPKTSRTSARA